MVDVHNHIRQGLIRLEKCFKTNNPWCRLWTTAFGCQLTTAYRLRQSAPGQQDLSVSDFLNATSQDLLRTVHHRADATSAPDFLHTGAHTPMVNPPRKKAKTWANGGRSVNKTQCAVCARLNGRHEQECKFRCAECGRGICRDKLCWDLHVQFGLPHPNPDERDARWKEYEPLAKRQLKQMEQ